MRFFYARFFVRPSYYTTFYNVFMWSQWLHTSSAIDAHEARDGHAHRGPIGVEVPVKGVVPPSLWVILRTHSLSAPPRRANVMNVCRVEWSDRFGIPAMAHDRRKGGLR